MNKIAFLGTDKEVLDFVGAKEFDYETDNNASVNVKLFGSHGHANVPLGYVFYKDTDEYGALSIVTDELDSHIEQLEKENVELRKVAEFQQFSNMCRHFESKKLKDTLVVGSTWNKHLNAQNKALVEERDKYRNMVFDKDEQLNKARKYIGFLLGVVHIKNTYNKEIEEEIAKCRTILEGGCISEEYFEPIRNLCKVCGFAIDKIAKQFSINQNLVAKLFMETMQTVLQEVSK